MSSRFAELSLDCADPDALAGFWRAALDYVTRTAPGEEDGVVSIGPADSSGPVLTFARVPESKIVKNRLHLDLRPLDRSQDAEVERLSALGARRTDVGQAAVSWVVMQDPEGNEFCVLAGD